MSARLHGQASHQRAISVCCCLRVSDRALSVMGEQVEKETDCKTKLEAPEDFNTEKDLDQ